jgi:chromosome segregation ATPase
MGGISNRNLKMFRKLCGEDALKNVIVVTTRWDDVPPKDREAMAKREEELMKTKGKFFEPLITAGGQFLRHDNTIGSARRVMEKLLDKDPIALQIQVEMKNGKKVEETAAGAELTAEMNKLIEKHTTEMNDLRKEMTDAIAEKDEQLRKELETERARLKGEMEKWESEKKRLAGDLDSVKQAADVAKKDAERKMGEQREEFNRKVRESEAKAEKERKELKAAMDQMATEKEDANRRLKGLEDTKNTADQNNKRLQAQIQAQIDQAKREREEADRKQQQLLLSVRARVSQFLALHDHTDLARALGLQLGGVLPRPRRLP